MKVFLDSKQQLAIRWSWSASEDLMLLCGLGGNRQFNFGTAHIVSGKIADGTALVQKKLPMRFHWCGDSVGVFHTYPDPEKRGVNILCGNHGYCGSRVTLPKHGFTAADIGKKLDKNHWIAIVPSADELVLLPGISKKELPKAEKIVSYVNFPASRILERTFMLDGKALPSEKIMTGKELVVKEKIGICPLPALAAAGFRQDAVTKFLAVYDIEYSFYPNGVCRVETRIFYPEDICLMGAGPMQDSDMELWHHDFCEKYIPKMKAIPENAPQGKPEQIVCFNGKKNVPDTRAYDFAAVQDMTAIRRQKSGAPRFQIRVNGGFVDPGNQPDRFIEFLGKSVQGKRVRKIGKVLGLDPEYGLCRPEERAKNNHSFILAAWHKNYPSVLNRPDRTFIKKGTEFLCVGYRCYFNPEQIGEATALYVIPHKDHKKIYADFHRSVRDYPLPFEPGAKVRILESSPGVTLKGNRLSVNGNYGYIVIREENKK